MERRTFLAGGVAFGASLATARLRAQPAGARRAAVVIGVDKPQGLPKLRAAASGAHDVEQWLKADGFEVRLFADDEQPVRASDLFTAIKGFVSRGTLDQLVVYFAGHGFISGSLSEFWLLSEGPDNPNEAVSLVESCTYAEQSGIPNVVFISDACRSRADSLSAERVHGTVVFPGSASPRTATSDVDQFLATRVGAAAYEVTVERSAAAFGGIFTSCFLDAFRQPYADMVQTVEGRPVVPNRRLKAYLAREVPKRAQTLSVEYVQQPDSKIYSDEPTYIAHVAAAERAAAPAPQPTLSDVAGAALGAAGVATPASTRFSDQELRTFATASGFADARGVVVAARGLPEQLSARSGFAVSGQRVAAVVTRPDIRTKVVNAGEGNRASALVEVDLTRARAATVALRFEDGTGTVLAGLEEFIGNVVVDAGAVTDVSYVPSRQSWMRSEYESEQRRLADLHAAVAAAARFGVFRFDGPRETRSRTAEQLAGRIRMGKGLDPTLGIYAAYAYADAGLPAGVASVRGIMRGQLEVDLFDVAMLSGNLTSRPFDALTGTTVPCCPMLSQGWALLRVRDVRLPESMLAARDHLRVALWLTLDREGMRIAENAVGSGRFR